MIAFLEGLVLERVGDAELVIGMPSGIGYRVAADCRGDRVGDLVKRWIHSITNEQGTKLYGFETQDERGYFLQLLAIESVGPKTALAVIAAAANPHNLASLQAVKGVGKKTAERIVEHMAGVK
jgi:Holliday junction DNA helicase RuvA